MTDFEQEVMRDAATYYVQKLLSNNAIQFAPGTTLEQASNVICQTMKTDPEARMDIVVLYWEEKLGRVVGHSKMIH